MQFKTAFIFFLALVITLYKMNYTVHFYYVIKPFYVDIDEIYRYA